jgi:hypothetical protein
LKERNAHHDEYEKELYIIHPLVYYNFSYRKGIGRWKNPLTPTPMVMLYLVMGKVAFPEEDIL